jgi:GT2 family glycosyltransferase
MNHGLQLLREESAEYILLMTQDVTVDRTTVRELLRSMLDDPSVGTVGPIVYYLEHNDKVFSAGGYVDVKRVKVGHYFLPRAQVPYEVDWIDGCCMLIRRQAVDSVGGFDEGLFMYYEENDLCQRVRRCGWKVVVAPSAQAWHEIGRGPRPFNYHYYMARNAYLYWAKNFGVGFVPVARSHVRSLARQYAAVFVSLVAPEVRARRGIGARFINSLRATKGFLLGSWHYLRNVKR